MGPAWGWDFGPSFDDAPPPAPQAPPAPPTRPRVEDGEDDATVARITLRLPEPLKQRAEDAAAAAGTSLNTWIVQAVRAATDHGAVHVDIDLSSMPFFGGPDPTRRGTRRMTGWV